MNALPFCLLNYCCTALVVQRMESGRGLAPASPRTSRCCPEGDMESCSCRCPNLPLNPGFNVVPGSSGHAHACRQPRAPRRSVTRSRIETGVADQLNDFVR